MNYPEIEQWTKEKTAEFILNNSLSEPEHRRNPIDVLEMGVDPLALGPAHLAPDDAWQCAGVYQDVLRDRRIS